MTSEEFRKNSELREGLRADMQRLSLQVALEVMKCKNESIVMPLGMKGIDHARVLAERQTRALVVEELREMTKPPPDAPSERPPEDFGTGHTTDEFDQKLPE